MTVRRTNRKPLAGGVAALAAASLVLAACGDDTGNDDNADAGSGDNGTEVDNGDNTDDATDDETDGPDDGAGGTLDGNGETVTLGYIPSWTDGLSTAYLLEYLLTDYGYEVEHSTISEAPLLYLGLEDGTFDLYPSAWPEVTHEQYMEEYGDGIEDWGTYYDGAVLTMAVPDYVDITSIEELNDNADMFGGQIIGIEPGAGLTGMVQDSVIPEYDLDLELVTSSTTAMLAELQSAVDAEEPIVVTLWRPYWANSEFPVRDLEDPMGALGEAEGLHFLANSQFAADNPELGEFISSIQLTDDEYGQLEDMVVNEYGEGRELEAVEAWVEANPDVIPTPGG